MSEPTARKYRRSGVLPSQTRKPRTWRTRDDPFESVWPEVRVLLEQDPGLEAKTVFAELQRRHPGQFAGGQMRTLQRRFRDHRALSGPPREVYFAQAHRPGEQGQSDFTAMGGLGVTIAGEPLAHLLYHFVLPYSNWESVSLCYSETFEALSEGIQTALWRLDGVPQMHRTDNLSAATHRLSDGGRAFTERYSELLEHYRLRGSRNTPGRAHENGDVESSHGGLKNAIDQRLRLRGHRDFATIAAYMALVQDVVDGRNAGREPRVSEERAVLGALPTRALPTYREEQVTVSRWGLIRIARKPYSLPSRLVGRRVQVRVYAERLEVRYAGELVASPARVRGEELSGIDYRHLVHSLVRKPGALQRYVYREALYPTFAFRRAYDALVERSSKRADLEYVRILHLAATTMQCEVEAALEALLAAGELPEFDAVKAIVRPTALHGAPVVRVDAPDLARYDQLITGVVGTGAVEAYA